MPDSTWRTLRGLALRYFLGIFFDPLSKEVRVLKKAPVLLFLILAIGGIAGFKLRGFTDARKTRTEQVFELRPSANGHDEISAAKGPPVVSIYPDSKSDYTFTISLQTEGATRGEPAEFYVEMPASAVRNGPSIEFRNADKSGTLLKIIQGDSSNAIYQTLHFRFDGHAWNSRDG